MSATQSLTSALRLNVGCISSMAPPNALAPMKTGSQAKAARAGQREGQCGEGNEVDNFVAARRRWRRLVQGPEHRDRERKEDDECQGNVEVLAHGAGVPAPNFEGKRRLILGAQHLEWKCSPDQGLVGSDKGQGSGR